MKRTNFQFIFDELRLELRPAIPFLISREPLSERESGYNIILFSKLLRVPFIVHNFQKFFF